MRIFLKYVYNILNGPLQYFDIVLSKLIQAYFYLGLKKYFNLKNIKINMQVTQLLIPTVLAVK
ncbi:hypothetical protein pb186bvf_020418 [Paramecium bursaria]